jgi:hypothetical protein
MQWLFLILAQSVSAGPALTFRAIHQATDPATDEYRQLWCAEGARVIATMERVTGYRYPGGAVDVLVSNNTPMTAFGGRSMALKASYPQYYKRATLVHELGHRLAFTMPRTADLDEHRMLYLFLYDVWSDLYGAAYAEGMVDIERRIKGRYDYAAAWDWALSMTRGERQARLKALRGQPAQLPESESANTAGPLPMC